MGLVIAAARTAAVQDFYNGEIIGLAMDDNMKKELRIRAFWSACQAQGVYKMTLHSDRGSQFTSAAFRKALAQYGAIQSIGHVHLPSRHWICVISVSLFRWGEPAEKSR